ncbi:hypothetical protein ElyMa_005790000 [Elysia marginata]|uniref:MARVEL domain-containing protein n=1 Tax=Elysia marginata TaxID=1093978 RepID=A0AAV4FSN6_9GAST|nr:hypothetical protein ElyMa_005790000 [Elysia marginata]
MSNNTTTKVAAEAVQPPPGNIRVQTIYVNGKAFSNPLYLKGMEVAILQLIIAGMCLTIYGYNIFQFKNHRLTKKMVFFPFLLFPGIIDNIYDYVTMGDVGNFETNAIVTLLIIMVLFAVLSLLYTAMYTYDAHIYDAKVRYTPLSQEDESGIELGDFDGGGGDKKRMRTTRWETIIEYMSANVVWAITTYNMMLILIYAARYISHTDHNYMRELDVAIISIVLMGFLVLLGVADFILFNNPANGSIFMQYVTVAFFALSLSASFHAQVGFCELLTVVGFLAAAFATVYRLVYMEIDSRLRKKQD